LHKVHDITFIAHQTTDESLTDIKTDTKMLTKRSSGTEMLFS